MAEVLPVGFLISDYLFGKSLSSNQRPEDTAPMTLEESVGKLTDGFSCEMDVSEPSQNMYSLVREHNSSLTRIFDGELCLP